MRVFIKTTSIVIAFFCAQVFAQNNIGCQAGKNSQLLTSIYYSPENHRSDTFDILKYTISLEIGNTTAKQIAGNTQIRFAPKLNNQNFVRFDLLKLTIDSIKENATLLTYTYNDTIVKVNFVSPKNTTDTSIFTVFYHGLPQVDQSGFGGFSFDNTGGAQYAYNLGVGFAAAPHNYGRVWFPCFDNFVERSKYEFYITSDTLRRAHCNGQLMSDVISSNKRTRNWVLNQEIPSYLACVALAKYAQVTWTVNTLSGVKPINLVAAAADTTALKNGFIHLKNCIAGFENYYGPYKWNKFGYSVVPFNGGAMEHATNIAYPKLAVGNVGYEAPLMAHELSHHWWGDLVTCETQEDMWLNEGMASYSSYLFTEWQYGYTSYLSSVKGDHDGLLQFLHHKEGFRAISGIPHDLTYGDHVYSKGADVAHTLRGYMGDAAFFTGLKYTLQQNAFKSLNSIEFRNYLQTSSGQNLVDFFNNWVFSAGWPHFSIDSVKYNQLSATSYDAVIAIKQKTLGAPALFTNVPLEISFFKNDWSVVTRTVNMNGATNTFTVNLPFNPVYHALNYNDKIGDATSHEIRVIKSLNGVNLTIAKVTLLIKNKGLDSNLVRVIHNYVKPDGFKNAPPSTRISDQHYWKVEGIFSPGFVAKATFNFDGTKYLAGAYAYMDTLLAGTSSDSIRLFYRANAADDWKVIKNMTKYINPNNKSGSITIDTLKIGEYAFGNTDTSAVAGIKEQFKNSIDVKVYPNPAKQKCTIEFKEELKKEYQLTLCDINGKILLNKKIENKITSVDLGQYAKGTYFIKIESENKQVYNQKLLVD